MRKSRLRNERMRKEEDRWEHGGKYEGIVLFKASGIGARREAESGRCPEYGWGAHICLQSSEYNWVRRLQSNMNQVGS